MESSSISRLDFSQSSTFWCNCRRWSPSRLPMVSKSWKDSKFPVRTRVGGISNPCPHRWIALFRGVHNLARATPLLGICHGVITERCVFRYISEHSSRQMDALPPLWVHSKYRNMKWRSQSHELGDQTRLLHGKLGTVNRPDQTNNPLTKLPPPPRFPLPPPTISGFFV